MCVCVCVCVTRTERERGRGGELVYPEGRPGTKSDTFFRCHFVCIFIEFFSYVKQAKYRLLI